MTRVVITLWPSLHNPKGVWKECTFQELFQELSDPQPGKSKNDLPGWSPGAFVDNKRSNKTVELLYALGLDDDKGTPLDRVVAIWGGFYGFVHTTWSSTPEHPRHRTILALSRPVTADEYKLIWRWAARRAAEHEQHLDEATKDPSRFWFVPALRPGGHFETRMLSGAVLDVEQVLAAERGSLFEGLKDAKTVEHKAHGYEAIIAEIGDGPGLKGFHLPLRNAVASYLASGRTETELLKTDLRSRIEAAPKDPERDPASIARYLTDEYLDSLIDSAREKPVFKFSETGNAERFAHQHRSKIRYVPAWGEWLIFDSRRWDRDVGNIRIEGLAKETLKSLYAEAATVESDDGELRKVLAGWARRSDSRKSISSMIALARSEKGLMVSPTELDPDPLLLNVENGTIDLRTGTLRPHRAEDMITKMAPVIFDPSAEHPVFRQYLHDATGGDPELEDYLARWAGYCASGLMTEKAFAFLHGPPNTAKSTFLDLLRATLGGYAVAAAPDTWLAQRFSGGNRGDLARLLGARLVTTSEFKKGAVFDEALIKGITGGDALTVAAKYEREVEFLPTCKIMLAANVAPAIDPTDEGMWGRCHRIPFTHEIPTDRLDPTIKLRLTDPKDAGPAILAWTVRGFLAWQGRRLARPAAVVESTAAYRRENDVVASFVAECCRLTEYGRAIKATVRDAFDQWCKENQQTAPNAREFRRRMLALGLTEGQDTSGTHRAWKGIELLDCKDRAGADDRPMHERVMGRLVRFPT